MVSLWYIALNTLLLAVAGIGAFVFFDSRKSGR